LLGRPDSFRLPVLCTVAQLGQSYLPLVILLFTAIPRNRPRTIPVAIPTIRFSRAVTAVGFSGSIPRYAYMFRGGAAWSQSLHHVVNRYVSQHLLDRGINLQKHFAQHGFNVYADGTIAARRRSM